MSGRKKLYYERIVYNGFDSTLSERGRKRLRSFSRKIALSPRCEKTMYAVIDATRGLVFDDFIVYDSLIAKFESDLDKCVCSAIISCITTDKNGNIISVAPNIQVKPDFKICSNDFLFIEDIHYEPTMVNGELIY